MKRIGIVAAMQEEFEEIETKMRDVEIKIICKLRFLIGKIGDYKCVLVQCGVGKVNAARTTQLMIDNFELESIINVGVAGSINDNLNIGDVIIGKHVVQHDFDITAFGHSKGYIPGIGNNIRCDEVMLSKFNAMMENIVERKYKIKLGVVATGDIFCTDITMKDKIHANFDADVVDMECAAIAQVAYFNNIPFAVIRSVSDTPNGENEADFEQNLDLASKRCANILEEFLY